MLTNKCAAVKMEEGYMRVTVEYTEFDCRAEICKAIGEVEKALDIYPEVIHRRVGDTSGTFSVEFGEEEDYVGSRTSGEFIERLLKKLEITVCDCA